MLKFQRFALLDKEGGGEGSGGDGGGGSGGGQVTPEVQAQIDAAVNAAVGGLKSKNTELLGAQKQLKDQLAAFEGIDPKAVHAIIRRFSDDEEAQLIKGGKIDEVLDKRTERMKQSFEKETLKEKQAREKAEQRAAKFTQRVLENHIRAEASGAGLHKHAVDDALFRAGSAFTIDDEGNAVAKEGFFGKDGKPLTLKEWFTDMKDKAPHWWPAQQGGGAQGGGSGSGKTIKRSEFDAKPPKERSRLMSEGYTLID